MRIAQKEHLNEQSGQSDVTILQQQEHLAEQIERLQQTLDSLVDFIPASSSSILAMRTRPGPSVHVRPLTQTFSPTSTTEPENGPLQLGHVIQALLAAKDHLLSQAKTITEVVAEVSRSDTLDAEVRSLRAQHEQMLVEHSAAKLFAQQSNSRAENLATEIEERRREITQLLRVGQELTERSSIAEQRLREAVQKVRVAEKRAETTEQEVLRLSEVIHAEQMHVRTVVVHDFPDEFTDDCS